MVCVQISSVLVHVYCIFITDWLLAFNNRLMVYLTYLCSYSGEIDQNVLPLGKPFKQGLLIIAGPESMFTVIKELSKGSQCA